MALPRLVVAAVAILSVLAFTAPASAHDSEQEQLEETQRERERTAAELDAARKTDDELAAALAEADRKVHGQQTAVDAADQRSRDADTRVVATERRIADTEAVIAGHREEISRRAIGAYKSADAGSLDSILGASDINEAVVRAEMLQKVFARDRHLLGRLKVLRADLVDLKAEVEADRAEAEKARLAAHEELHRLEEARDEAAVLKAAIDARVAQLDAEYRALQEAEERIAAAIKRREELFSVASAAGIDFGGPPSSAGFVNPTGGILTSAFGPRWGRLHAGIDIANDTGTPVVAAAYGLVIDAGWYGGYGNAVLLEHGGGLMTLYGHLDSVAVAYGQVVDQGEYVGPMGSTGNSTGPHLHFEVRVGGEPVDPLAYLP